MSKRHAKGFLVTLAIAAAGITALGLTGHMPVWPAWMAWGAFFGSGLTLLYEDLVESFARERREFEQMSKELKERQLKDPSKVVSLRDVRKT